MRINFKNAVIRGTIILTLAGILSRVIGFFYRIFLTRAIGSEGMGLFQLVTPVIGIVFAVCCAGVQTGISRFSATGKKSGQWLISGLLISLPLSIFAAIITYFNADYIATRLLLNADCSGLLRIMAFSFPFAAFHNCINGYYYGKKCAEVPAMSQLFEQLVRVAAVFIYAHHCTINNIPITVECALYANLAGELASFLFCIIALAIHKHYTFDLKETYANTKTIFLFSLPLTFNRLLMHLLQSGEAILIPAQLMLFGHSRGDALSLYGVLNGMVMPLILFPSAITNSLSVMLLPEVSQAQAQDNDTLIVRTFKKSITLCMTMGIMSTLLFLFYGASIGATVFDEPLVYSFSLVIAWLCPFIYLSTTLGSILNGLGLTTTTCIHNVICILIRITFLILLVPTYGITGYLIGLLVAQIFICLAHYIKISRMFHIAMNPYDLIIIPMLYCLIAIGMSLIGFEMLNYINILPTVMAQCICAAIACLLMVGFLYKSQKFTAKQSD